MHCLVGISPRSRSRGDPIAMSATENSVRVARDGGVAQVIIENPPVNALSWSTLRHLRCAASEVSADDSVKAVIVTGDGSRSFCAGADFKEAGGLSDDGRAQRLADLVLAFEAVRSIPVPVVCAINGPAAGGGLLLAALCDYRVIVRSAFVSMPEIDRGTVAAGPILRRLGCSEGVLRKLLFTGSRIDAQAALRDGLVDEVVADQDELASTTADLTETLVSKSRAGLVGAKQLLEEQPSRVYDLETTFMQAHRFASSVRSGEPVAGRPRSES